MGRAHTVCRACAEVGEKHPHSRRGLAPEPSPVTILIVEKSSSRPAQLDAMIREIAEELREMPITPHVRELRAKTVTYGRVIGSWATYAPTGPQVQAMLECVTELQQKVRDTKHESNRDVSKVTRRQADDDTTMTRTSKRPPLPPGLPPSFTAWSASVPDAGAHGRSSSKPAPRNERNEVSTRAPPPPGRGAPPPPPPTTALLCRRHTLTASRVGVRPGRTPAPRRR